MASRKENQTFEERLERIEALVETIQTAAVNPALRTSAEELVETLLELHGSGLERMLDVAYEAAGQPLIDTLAEDDLVGSLLLLHGLHPMPLEARVQQALEKVRPYLQSHNGDVEVLGIRDGVVQLRLRGNCEGCPASALTLKLAVEEAIYEAAPDVIAIESVQGKEAPTPAVNGAALAGAGSQWHEVGDFSRLEAGTLQAERVAGQSVLFCRLNGQLYAYGNSCPACQQTLETARLEEAALSCPHCGQSYDVVRAGRGMEQADLQLRPVPLIVEQDRVQIALSE